MRISAFIQLAIQCLIIASILVSIIGIIYCIYIILQKKKHKEIQLNKKKIISSALFIGYIAVIIFATILLERSSRFGNSQINLYPLSSYRYAWNHFQMREWRNIILNICMFVPLGMILPLYDHVFRKSWLTYISGFGLTLFIESTQYITKRGIFEIDDMINNTIGCMIGFGLWTISYYIYQKMRKQPTKNLFLLQRQIPLICTIFAFLTIFTIYNQKDLGNIRQNNYQTVDMSNIKLINETQLSTQKPLQYVYQAKKYTEEECYKIAKYYFDKENLEIDDSLTDKYDETIIYYTKDRNMYVWVNYIGATLSIHFPYNDEDNCKGLSSYEIQEKLNTYQIQVPPNAKFIDNGQGYYRFVVNNQISDGKYINGEIRCRITKSKKLQDIDYSMKTYETFQEYQLISTGEAFQQIKKGYFNQEYLENIENEIIIKKVRLSYTEDTKGFMQPIYEFVTNGKGIIYIPAI